MRNSLNSLGLRMRFGWRRAALLFLVAVLSFAAQGPMPVLGAPEGAEQTVYVVGWGDTLSGIAGRYGTTVSAIVQANGMANPNYIYVGQRLAIPANDSPAPAGSGVYLVKRGDTLSAIAVRHRTTVTQLIQMNGLVNPNFILVGQRLAVPQGEQSQDSGSQPTTGTVYTVQRGDTLIGIALRLQVAMWDIVLANNIANPSLIYVGQSLVIPGGGTAPNRTPIATPTSEPAATPQPNAATPRPATPTATQPKETPAPKSAFSYVQGSMQHAPNCGTVYLKGKITGVGGEPVNGKTVRLRFAGNVVYRVSGDGQDPGQWSFAPLAGENYHSPFSFLVDVVESQANPAPQSDTLTIDFHDCDAAGQFTDILFRYGGGSSVPDSNPTVAPADTPTSTYVPIDPSPVDWDPRLNQLPCVRLVSVAERGMQPRPGERYWRLVKARWLSEEESRRDIQIHVDLLDESGERVYGESVVFENGGRYTVISEPQSCCYPWDYPVKWPMFSALCAYSAYVEGLPSDMVTGMGLGTPEHPDWTVHTGFVLTFQRTVYR
jgi:LysM repeat protein